MSERTKRQSFLGAGSDDLLASLRIAVVGVGGGGSHIVQQLAHIGVGTYILVDPDRIEASNTNRLIGGTVADVRAKRWKTTIAARLVKRVLPTGHIIEIKHAWQLAAEDLRDCDIIYGCLDSFVGRRELEEAARRFMIPYIDIGMDVIQSGDRYAIVGQVALSMPGRLCLRCMGVVRDSDVAEEAKAYGAAGGKPQVVWPNGVLASLAVGIGLQLVCPWHNDHREVALLEYDGNSDTVVASTLLSALSTHCPHFAAVNTVGDPWFAIGHAGASGAAN